MAGPAVFPDVVYDVPIFNDFPVGIPVAGATGGRLMSSMPHVDGVCIYDAFDVKATSSGTAGVLTRIGKGDWVLRAQTAANTNFYAANISSLGYRTGENYIFAVNEPSSGAKLSPAPPAKGVAVTSIFAEINIGVAALASGTLGLSKTVYVNNVARVVTDIVAPTALTAGQLAVSTNGSTLITIAVPGNPDTQAFITDPTALWQLELSTVQAATTTLDFIALGIGYNFNWN